MNGKRKQIIIEEFVSSLNVAKVRELKGSKALIKWLEEVTVLLGKKGDEMYQELKKLLDKVLDWIKNNSKQFENNSNYYKLYNNLIIKGKFKIKREYKVELKKLIKEADSQMVQKRFEKDFAGKKINLKESFIYNVENRSL